MSVSSESTLCDTNSKQCGATDSKSIPAESTPDVVWQTLRTYVADNSYPSSQRTKLNDLIEETKKQWDTILIEPIETEDTFKVSPGSIEYQPPDHWRPDHGTQQMSELCKDLLRQCLFTGTNTEETMPTELNLQRDYIFMASLGMKSPFKKEVFAAIGVSSSPEVVLVSYPGRRVRAVGVGYCAQYDSDVYFAADGGIYLVESDQVAFGGGVCYTTGMQVFESEQTLDKDWRTFALE
jgi:hypothetical protein